MLAFGIHYLTGFVTATEPDVHERVEWPPHPGRIFMALAAAHFQTGADPSEREALAWIERLEEAPVIRAGAQVERQSVTQYVPVNDRPGDRSKPPIAPIQSVPQLARDRQPRTFARAFLEDEIVYMAWPSAEPPEAVRDALRALCSKVTRIGHSSSLVHMWVAADTEVGEPTWRPNEKQAAVYLRVPGRGTLAELERAYNGGAVEEYADLAVAAADDTDSKAQQDARRRLRERFPGGAPAQQRPRLSVYRGYAPAKATRETDDVRGTVFGPYPIVLTLEREDGARRHLDLPCVLAVVQRWREAILSMSDGLPDEVRGLLSGHNRDGGPLERPHLAFLPLAFVGHPHADGRLLGMGLALPASTSRDARRAALRIVGAVRRLVLGRLGTWTIAAERRSNPPWTLRPEAWTAYPDGATHWSTITPVVFDRHPKAENRGEHEREAAEMIATACTRIGLPQPREVIVTHVSAHIGVPPAFAFPRMRRKDGSERRHTHAILVFEKPVCGPVLIGAGRYRGYGVGRPLDQ